MSKRSKKAAGKRPSTPRARRQAASRAKAPPVSRREAEMVKRLEAERRARVVARKRELAARKKAYEAWLKAESRRSRRGVALETLGVSAGPFTILAEGDSWFDYPQILGTGGGAITHLQELFDADRVRCRILNLAQHGHTVQGMLGVEQRRTLRAELARAVRNGRPYRALLFSGGGNDIAGDQFLFWIKRRTEAASLADAIDDVPFRAMLAVIEKGYRDLVRLRDEESPDTVLIVHGYDYPRVFGTGVCGAGPWLEPSLAYRGWSAPEYFDVVRACLQRFEQVLAGMAAVPANKMVLARTQGALTQQNQWHNELHPNRRGFPIVAARLREALRSAFPGEGL